jgi:hypothetical protein
MDYNKDTVKADTIIATCRGQTRAGCDDDVTQM